MIYAAAGVADQKAVDATSIVDAIGAECHARGWRSSKAVVRGLARAAFVEDVVVAFRQRHLPEDAPTPPTVTIKGREHTYQLAGAIVAYNVERGQELDRAPHAFAADHGMWPGAQPTSEVDDLLYLSGVDGTEMTAAELAHAALEEDTVVLVYVLQESTLCSRRRSVVAVDGSPALRREKVFVDALPDARHVSDYLVTQTRGTCYIAAALNVLFSVPALRHFMISVLNTELVAAEIASRGSDGSGGGGAARLLADLEGPFRFEPLRTAMLRLVARHLCGERKVTEPMTHILEAIVRPDKAEELAAGKESGGTLHQALGAMLLALGVPPKSVAIVPHETMLGFQVLERSTIDSVVYVKEAMLGAFHVRDLEGAWLGLHAVTGVFDPSTGRRSIFNPWGCMYDVDWLHGVDWQNEDPWELRSPSCPKVLTIRLADLRNLVFYVALSEEFKRRHARPSHMRPVCFKHVAPRAPFHKLRRFGSSLTDMGADAGRNVAMNWLNVPQSRPAFPAVIPAAYAGATCEPSGQCAFNARGYPTSVPIFTIKTEGAPAATARGGRGARGLKTRARSQFRVRSKARPRPRSRVAARRK